MNEPEWTTAVARFGIGAGGAGGVVPTAMGAPNLRNGCGPPPLPRRLFSPSRKASATYHHQHHHNQLMALAPPASAQLPAATAATAASCPIGGESSAADTSHYTTSNSSSSGAQSAVDCKRTRGGCAGTVATATTVGCPTVIDRLAPANGASAAAQQPPAVPPPSVNTTDTTTSDFTSSGFTSSSPTNCGTIQMLIGHHQHQQLPTMAPVPIETSSSLANSFSSGCAEVGAGGADGGGGLSSSDESSSSSSSSSSSPVVVELATNDVGPVQAASADGQQQQQQQFRKASLQHHYSPMRVHRGGGGGGGANGGNRSSPQKVGPTSPLKQQQQASSAELVDPYNNNSAMQQQSSSPTTKRRGGGGGRLRSALAATTDNTMVRRVASFTFSPPLRAGSLQHNQLQHQLQQQQFLSALDKHCNSSSSNNSAAGALRLDKRNSVASGGGAGGTDKLQRRMALGPLSKTLHFLRTKLDFSMSASVLCPSREDCRLWQESFDALLAHKYGCLLFREFLQSEFSEENLEFWLECEQFKRMKPAKKSTGQKANQIYDTFIRELAPKEVNLDSQTRLATQAALSVVPLRADMFMLAQQKIAQLMAKDSYPRFLKSEQYLELLNNNNNGNNNNENDGGEHMQPPKGLLRVASAREGCAVTTKSLSSLSGASCSRSPSLSPRSGGAGAGRWHTRRNTCAPTTTPMPMLAGAHTKKGATGAGNNGTIPTNILLSGGSGAGGPTPLTLQIPSIAE
ncbi:hypothetical protein niasHT_036263 [Heterodera trifolii]|uniref:RGS domain-containing protein n=1 Tax=Heterodera trifolii TaxID=157864 RepID=A0ABD2IRA4_9BILA